MTRRARWSRLFAILSASVLFGNTSSAQQGPIIYGEHEKRPLFKVQSVYAAAEFLFRNQSDEIKQKGSPANKFSEMRFEETLSLETRSFVYHPNLLDISAAGSFGLQQIHTNTSGAVADQEGGVATTGSEDFNGIVYDYDIEGTFFRKSTTPLTLYARRTQDTVDRTLGPTLENTIDTYGAILDIRSKNIPTRIEAYHSDQTQRGPGDIQSGNSEFDLHQNTVLWHSEIRPTRRQVINWDYNFSQVDQSTSAQVNTQESYITHDATLSHSVDFGDKDQHNLTSTLNYFNQSGGVFDIERLHLSELMHLKHSDTFETNYEYTLDQQTFQDVDQLQQRGRVGFLYRIYKSVIITGNLGVQDVTRSDGGDTFEYFGDIRADYTKKIPYGAMHLFIGYAYDYQDNKARNELTEILDSQRTFTDPFPVTINGPRIIPSSIVVTDQRGLVIFTPGLDYLINPFTNHVDLTRVVGGRIENDQPVLIDYQLEPAAGNTVTTNVYTFGGQYTIDRGILSGLSPYARFTRQDQQISSDDPLAFTPNTFNDLTAGVEYRRGGFDIGFEYENHDSTISPFDSNRYWGRYGTRLKRDTTITGGVTYTQVDYNDTGNHVDLLYVDGTVSHDFTNHLRATASVLWQNEEDDFAGGTDGWQEQVELQWSQRQTSVYLNFRNVNLSTDFTDRNFQFLEIGIRREF